MFKNSQASTIQELKIYISTLEFERERLKSMTVAKRDLVLKRMQEQDFNKTQIQKMECAFEKIKTSLQNIFERTS